MHRAQSQLQTASRISLSLEAEHINKKNHNPLPKLIYGKDGSRRGHPRLPPPVPSCTESSMLFSASKHHGARPATPGIS